MFETVNRSLYQGEGSLMASGFDVRMDSVYFTLSHSELPLVETGSPGPGAWIERNRVGGLKLNWMTE